jgi:hypothetical protein
MRVNVHKCHTQRQVLLSSKRNFSFSLHDTRTIESLLVHGALIFSIKREKYTCHKFINFSRHDYTGTNLLSQITFHCFVLHTI